MQGLARCVPQKMKKLGVSFQCSTQRERERERERWGERKEEDESTAAVESYILYSLLQACL
jgi:hypothetical protein